MQHFHITSQRKAEGERIITTKAAAAVTTTTKAATAVTTTTKTTATTIHTLVDMDFIRWLFNSRNMQDHFILKQRTSGCQCGFLPSGTHSNTLFCLIRWKCQVVLNLTCHGVGNNVSRCVCTNQTELLQCKLNSKYVI